MYIDTKFKIGLCYILIYTLKLVVKLKLSYLKRFLKIEKFCKDKFKIIVTRLLIIEKIIFSYFSKRANDLDWVMYRMGILACLRSICLKRQYIGCMITASHNPVEDNGCKLVDPLGDMLEEKWETYASQLVNSK